MGMNKERNPEVVYKVKRTSKAKKQTYQNECHLWGPDAGWGSQGSDLGEPEGSG